MVHRPDPFLFEPMRMIDNQMKDVRLDVRIVHSQHRSSQIGEDKL